MWEAVGGTYEYPTGSQQAREVRTVEHVLSHCVPSCDGVAARAKHACHQSVSGSFQHWSIKGVASTSMANGRNVQGKVVGRPYN